MRTKIKGIVLHCSAGFGDIHAIQAFWRNNLKWTKSKGYAVFIETSGKRWFLTSNTAKQGYSEQFNDLGFELPTNGVKGYNKDYLHICYQGGIEKKGNKILPKNTLTPEQADAFHLTIKQVKEYFSKRRNFDLSKDFGVWGHFDFSPDKNGTGVIESWERIKECPVFSVMESEYHKLYSSPDRIGTLPYNRAKMLSNEGRSTHTVIAGDTLSRIARVNNTTVLNIKNLNHLSTDFLRPGQVLIVK